MQTSTVLFALFALFAAALGASITDLADIPDSGILVTLRTDDGDYARLLPNHKLFVDTQDPSKAATFQVKKKFLSDGTTVALTFQNLQSNKYVSAEMAGKKSIRATRPAPKSWESFLPTFDNEKLTLVSVPNNRILAVQTTNTIIANQDVGSAAGLRTVFVLETVQIDAGNDLTTGLNFLRQNNLPIGGLSANVIYPSDGAATYTITPVETESSNLWQSFNLLATANQMYLCSESGVFAPTCTDPNDVSTHYHFWEPLSTPSNTLDAYVMADHTNQVAQIQNSDSCTSTVPCTVTFSGTTDVDHTAQFEFTPSTPLDPNAVLLVSSKSVSSLRWNLVNNQVVLGSGSQLFTFRNGYISGTTLSSTGKKFFHYIYIDNNSQLMYTNKTTLAIPSGTGFNFTPVAATTGSTVLLAENGKYATIVGSTVAGSILKASSSVYGLDTTAFALGNNNQGKRAVVEEVDM